MGGVTPAAKRSCSRFTETSNGCPRTNCAYQKLGLDLETLVDGGAYSDFTVKVQGKEFALHRCILSVRSRFFREYFAKTINSEEVAQMDLGKVDNLDGVGYEAFASVVKFMYGAKERLAENMVKCVDEACNHDACWPVVNYVIEYLRTADVFEIPELTADAENHLLSLVKKTPVEYLLTALVVANIHDCKQLRAAALETLAEAKWNYLSLQKLLPKDLVEEIKRMKKERGHVMPTPEDEKLDEHAEKVQQALDSDDVELVSMMLQEGKVDFDQVHGLHYAAAYCDEKTVRMLLDMQLSDVNRKNYRGLTVLHIACMRREPEILASLLAKGARPSEVTPDGRTPSQIVKRLIKDGDNSEEESERARLCLELLEREETPVTPNFCQTFKEMIELPIKCQKDLEQKLLYLENRMALAKMLFPRESQIVVSVAHVDATAEYTGVDTSSSDSRSGSPSSFHTGSPNPYLCGSPCSFNSETANPFHRLGRSTSVNHIGADTLPFDQGGRLPDVRLLQRVNALRKACEFGHRFFPRCSAMINKYMDDGMTEFPTVILDLPSTSDEPSPKKQRLIELKESLAEALPKDIAEMSHQRGLKKLPPSLSPTSSSSQGGSSFSRRGFDAQSLAKKRLRRVK